MIIYVRIQFLKGQPQYTYIIHTHNTHTYTHICTHEHVHPYTRVRTHNIPTYTSTCIHTVAYVHVHTHTNTRTYTYTQVHVRTHTCDTVMQGLRLMTGSVSTKLPISSWSFFLQKNQLLLSFCHRFIFYIL